MIDRLLNAMRPWHVGLALALLLAAMAVNGLSSHAYAAEGGEEQVKAAPEPENALIWIAKTSGFIGLVLLVLSVYFVSTACRMFVELRPVVVAPPEIVSECQEMLQKRQFKEIYNVVKDDQSFYSRVLSTGIAELPSGLSEAREGMERVGEALTAEMEKKISMLAVLGTLGPMIGLLGTLKGMIGSFSVIARSDAVLKASEVAGNISEALLLTFEGVALSVPAIYFFAIFRNRVSSLTITTLLECDEFLRHFAHAARSKTPPAAAAAAPPKPAKA